MEKGPKRCSQNYRPGTARPSDDRILCKDAYIRGGLRRIKPRRRAVTKVLVGKNGVVLFVRGLWRHGCARGITVELK